MGLNKLKGKRKMSQVIVLNTDMTILGTTHWKRAMILIAKGKAEVLAEDTEIRIHPTVLMPKVIRLITAIRNLWRTQVPWSKANVHVRDMYTCQYCDTKLKRNKATIDHVIPQAQGGKNKWDNTVTACFPCNNKKRDRTPREANMSLRKGLPHQPTIMEFLIRKVKSEGLDEVLKELGIY